MASKRMAAAHSAPAVAASRTCSKSSIVVAPPYLATDQISQGGF
jgi:hypothetical protein